MDTLLDYLPSILKNSDEKSRNRYLKTCTELSLFHSKSENLVSFFNPLLNEPDTRLQGLVFLKVFLPQCKKSVMNENIMSWCQQCLKGLITTTGKRSTIFDVFGDLLQFAAEFPDVKKQISLHIMPKLLDILFLDLKEKKVSPEILYCFEMVLLHYNRSCGNQKSALEAKLVLLMADDQGMLLMRACRCFALLPGAGLPGVDGSTHRQAWAQQHLTLVNTLHLILDSLFFGLTEIQGAPKELPVVGNSSFSIPEVRGSSLRKVQALSNRFQNLSQMLESTLLSSFPAPKTIIPDVIFSLVWRVLSINCKTLETSISNENCSLLTEIINLHVSSLSILNALISCGRGNLLPFSSLISKLIVQTFKWTELKDASGKSFSRLRTAAYNSLSCWLCVAKSGTLLEPYFDTLVNAIKCDIQYKKPTLELTVEVKVGNKKSKKKHGTAPVHDDFMGVPDPEQQTLCHSALTVMKELINYCSCQLSANHHQVLQEVTVQELMRGQDGTRNGKSDWVCTRALYSALHVLCTAPHPTFPPPLPYALYLFRIGLCHPSTQVSGLCREAINSVHHMIHPSHPSFDFPHVMDSNMTPINPIPESSVKNCNKREANDSERASISTETDLQNGLSPVSIEIEEPPEKRPRQSPVSKKNGFDSPEISLESILPSNSDNRSSLEYSDDLTDHVTENAPSSSGQSGEAKEAQQGEVETLLEIDHEPVVAIDDTQPTDEGADTSTEPKVAESNYHVNTLEIDGLEIVEAAETESVKMPTEEVVTEASKTGNIVILGDESSNDSVVILDNDCSENGLSSKIELKVTNNGTGSKVAISRSVQQDEMVELMLSSFVDSEPGE